MDPTLCPYVWDPFPNKNYDILASEIFNSKRKTIMVRSLARKKADTRLLRHTGLQFPTLPSWQVGGSRDFSGIITFPTCIFYYPKWPAKNL